MRKFSDEEKEIIRRLVIGEGYSRNIVNLIADRNLEAARFVANRETLSAEIRFETSGGEPSAGQVEEMARRQDEIAKMLILYIGLIRYLEKYDLAISYKPASSSSDEIGFGKGAVNTPAHSWQFNDCALVGLIVEYHDKEIIPLYPIRSLVGENFTTDEEKRFKSQHKATWTAIRVSIGLGLSSLAIGIVGIYLRVTGKT